MAYSKLEIEFIKEELDLHGEYLVDLFEEDIVRKGLIKFGDLLSIFRNENAYSVSERAGGTVVLSIKFPNYGRFIEIQKHKKKIRTEDSKLKRSKWNKKRKRKDTSWYTHNVYGAQNKLMGRLMYGFSEEIKKKLKQRLESQKNLVS